MTPAEWIEKRQRCESPRNQCSRWTSELVAQFPELTRTRGHVVYPDGRRIEHWWTVATDGSIVDPTVAQFKPGFTYEPLPADALEPIGKCLWCGSYVWPPRITRDACSDECYDSLVKEYQWFKD